jgi:molybdenum cofactor biosynthesis protein B
MSHTLHRQHADAQVGGIRCGVLTISDTRTFATDTGGQLAQQLLQTAGHQIVTYTIVRDEPIDVVAQVRQWCSLCQVIITTGGTGIAKRDTTIDALEPLFDRRLPGFGEIFRMLSFAQVGAAAMLSRATAGTIAQTLVFCLPGSPAAVELAMTQLIVPELRHLVWETVRQGPLSTQGE